MGNWIEWNGGKCPVEKGTIVDVKHRDGGVYENQEAGHADDIPMGYAEDWGHELCDGDIIAYRLHKPEQQKPLTEQLAHAVRKRDKQHEKFRKHSDRLSLCEANVNDLIKALEREIEEATGLPCRIGGEIIKGTIEDRPDIPEDVDVDDPKTWEKGDVIECASTTLDAIVTAGKEYVFDGFDSGGDVKLVEDDDGDNYAPHSGHTKFRFVRRPS